MCNHNSSTTLSLLYTYQWIRDHWHRQYNGRVRCCCGWYQGGSQPVTQGRIANRCDYRRLVTETEDVTQCRDANEDHGLGFEGVGDTGCDSQYASQINAPIPEDDSVCWEIQRFGYTEEPVPVPTMNPTPTDATPRPSNAPIVTPPPTESTAPTPPTVTSKPTVRIIICIALYLFHHIAHIICSFPFQNEPTKQPIEETTSTTSTTTAEETTSSTSTSTTTTSTTSATEEPPPNECVDSPFDMIHGRNERYRDADWVAARLERRCRNNSIASHFPLTCDRCEEYGCEDSMKEFVNPEDDEWYTCEMAYDDPSLAEDLCTMEGGAETCRELCGYCELF